ncbi:MAG: NAD(P)/FAD-dependent oxidoreductase [Aeromicrobium sp.]|uniref:phytoene desaturase family protein n=1 Tax=Aeromicrobium sp. TaxID=1871063 RepID=UPI00261202A4|nr:NAD(P)/FAD-dependent oxidoreductase [Aeromicrobium sp.]MDF1703442.1 NAD(P)/FAD-dependent oxidoreductase [Aeromicrobium sp.]
MSQIVVVGAGFAGLSAAVRLAKSHHDVTLLEASERVGGALHGIEIDGRRWNLHPQAVTTPGVFRDLFRKSGRTMEASLGLAPAPPRRHVFASGSVLDLPHGHRSEQHDAIEALVGFDTWSPWVDSLAEVWEVLRRQSYDQVLTGPEAFDRTARKLLHPRRMMTSFGRRSFGDPRLRKLVLDPVRHHGLDRGATPAFLSVWHYVERTFGQWSFDGDWPGLAAALEKRLRERKVDLRTGTRGLAIARDGDRVVGVDTDAGRVDAEVVIWCNRSVPTGDARRSGTPAVPASRTFLVLGEDPPELAPETLVHGNPPVLAHRTSPGVWTLEHRSGEDVLAALARSGIDLRDRVLERHDLNPSQVVGHVDDGWTWTGWTSMFQRPGVAPAGGLFHAGAHAHPGPRLEHIGMATAAISAAVGTAPRR